MPILALRSSANRCCCASGQTAMPADVLEWSRRLRVVGTKVVEGSNLESPLTAIEPDHPAGEAAGQLGREVPAVEMTELDKPIVADDSGHQPVRPEPSAEDRSRRRFHSQLQPDVSPEVDGQFAEHGADLADLDR